MKTETKKFFYGWYIVAACFILSAMTYGAINNCMGVFIKPVCADMGYSRSAFGLVSTIMSGSLMIMSLLSGKLFRHLDVTKTLRFCAIVMAAGYFSFSFARSLPMFYLSALVTGLAEGTITTVALSILISNWFHQKRGLAFGIAFMGSGVGGMICNPLASMLIQNMGWRMAYRILAVTVFVFAVPVAFLILRTRPEQMDLTAYGEEKDAAAPVVSQQSGMMAWEAMRTPGFWVLCLCCALNTICSSGLMQNTAPHISDVGYSPTFAASVASANMGALALGKLLLGWLYDKLGVKKATIISHLFAIIGLCGALLAPALPGVGLIVLGVSLGGAFGTVAYPLVAQAQYGNRDYGSIMGVMTAFANVGGMLIPILVGGSFDLLGSYKPAFTVMIGLLCLMIGVYCFLFRTKKPA